MNSREEVLQKIRRDEPELREMGVRNLWIFGSCARGESGPNDVDFLVEFEVRPTLVGFMNLKFFLEESLQMKVDLHTLTSCPDRFMKRIRPDLLHVA